MPDVKEVVKTIHYKAGYVVKWELIDGSQYGSPDFLMKSAFTPTGDYIGSPKNAYHLCKVRGIKPESRLPVDSTANNGKGRTASIGFCEKEQKWYGWSHRAIYGFKVGDEVKEGDCTAESGWIDEYLAEHPEEDLSLPVGFVSQTLDDTKRMAIAFAESVS